MYISLFHGRNDPFQSIENWGFVGELIGPVQLSWANGKITLHDPETWDGCHLKEHNGLIRFNGSYYANFDILEDSDPLLNTAVNETRTINFKQFKELNEG